MLAMPDPRVIIPVSTPSGSVYFASVARDSSIADLISSLIESGEIKAEILGDFEEIGWDIQKICKENPGRSWEEEDLNQLEHSILPQHSSIEAFIPSSIAGSVSRRHFSSFPLSSHLHSPSLRLVSRHPCLSVNLQFSRVPEIPDDFTWNFFLSRNTSVQETLDGICEQLGLARSLPVEGAGEIQYIIELDSNEQRVTLDRDAKLSNILVETGQGDSLFRFCVPKEWYLGSKASSNNREDAEGGDTAKQKNHANKPETIKEHNTGSSATRRFSIFDGWLRSSDVADREKLAVSDPTPVMSVSDDNSGVDLYPVSSDEISVADNADFERMINELGLKGEKREAMCKLPPVRKRYLLQQNRLLKTGNTTKSSQPGNAASLGPARASALLPALMPQLTGDFSFMRRLSSSWTGSLVSENIAGNSLSSRSESSQSFHPPVDPLQPQSTGGLWSSWWSFSSDDSNSAKKFSVGNGKTSSSCYIDSINNRKGNDGKFLKLLISLRVHLSTVKLSWVEQFVNDDGGLDVLGHLLASLVDSGGKYKALTETEEAILYEIVKCFRVLLNTEPGFNYCLATPALITHVAYTIHLSSSRLIALSSDLLAAICILSITHGHKLVLSALSDYRIAFEESFRFEELLTLLRLPNNGSEDHANDANTWEARTAILTLINALTTCPESLEERVQLREEFGRRGLNEIIVALRYIKPPEMILTQIDVYTEEKFEDEEDMRERLRNAFNELEIDSDTDLAHIMRIISVQQGQLRSLFVELLKNAAGLLSSDDLVSNTVSILKLANELIKHASTQESAIDDWLLFLNSWLISLKKVFGEELETQRTSKALGTLSDGEVDEMRKESEELRSKVSDLSEELSQQRAEAAALNALLKSAPGTVDQVQSGREGFQGLVQRLIQKEKQMVHLSAEVERLKHENLSAFRNDIADRVRFERDRLKLTALTDEAASLRARNQALEQDDIRKDKEIMFFKRALESVYTRLASEPNSSTELDPQEVASQTLHSLARKDEEIKSLRADLDELRKELIERSKSVTEQQYKKFIPPPPPPPPFTPEDRGSYTIRQLHVPLANDLLDRQSILTLLPPPPPPPPPLPRESQIIRSTTTSMNQISRAPPPPPPPPPPMPSAAFASPPPPPPPPMGSRMIVGSTLPNIKIPGKKLRPFFWDKISPSGKTIWDYMQLSVNSIDLGDLEDVFALVESNSKALRTPQSSPKKTSVATLLDTTRANNVSIMLSRIKLSLPDIKRALLTMDDTLLSIDDLKAISRHLPTTEEIKRLREFGDTGQLAKPDQYFAEIMSINRIKERLDCTIYRRKLDLEIAEVRPELDILRQTTKELLTCDRLKEVLQVILLVGNALNKTSFRGNARGFRLDALLKMKETKTANGSPDCPTLLHYVARSLLISSPDLINFADDLSHLEAAARVSVQSVSSVVAALSEGLAMVQSETAVSQSETLEDKYVDVMNSFVREATPRVHALEKMNKSVEEEVKSLMIYFGEVPDSPEGTKPEDFFNIILSFSTMLRKAALEILEAQARIKLQSNDVRLKSKRLEKAENSFPMRQSAGGKQLLLVPPPDSQEENNTKIRNRTIGRGDVDEAIRSMRRGTVRRTRDREHRPVTKIYFDGN